MPEPNEINVMMEFFKGEDDKKYEPVAVDPLNEEKYIIDDSIFDEPSEDNSEEKNKPAVNISHSMSGKVPSERKSTYLRVLNASPGSPGFDVVYEKYNSGKIMLAGHLRFAKITDYKSAGDGLAKIYIYHSSRKNPVTSFSIDLPAGGYYTLILCGSIHNLRPLISWDMSTSAEQDHACVRLINLSPGSDSVDLMLNNQMLFSCVDEETITKYTDIKPDIYNLKLLYSGTKEVMLSGKNVIFRSNRAYTIYVLGLVQGCPGMAFAISLDGT